MVLSAEDGGKNGHVVSFKAVGWGSAQLKLLLIKDNIIFPSQHINRPSVSPTCKHMYTLVYIRVSTRGSIVTTGPV